MLHYDDIAMLSFVDIQLGLCFNIPCRNAATETVKQELKFVGQESGKLLAMREILRQVSNF